MAGPVAIGAVRVRERFNIARAFPGLADSKQLSPKHREEIYRELRGRMRAEELTFCARFASAAVIDRLGITRAIDRAIARGVLALVPEPAGVRVYLDGLLRAPGAYSQQTIIGGDEAVPVIALASIVAKVSRDRLMGRLAKRHPLYGFDRHKGYGTQAHYAALALHGPCEIHRKSYLHLDRAPGAS